MPNQTLPQPLTLLFGVHAHQPVGNFPEVIETAHLNCYRMFIRTLAEYSAFRFSVHFSGWLLDELTARWPQDLALLGEMTARGQVEWFGSGDCEPVLAAIPQRDRLSQLTALSDKIERRYGQRPRGAWLTERVWEASVVGALAEAGIEFVAVDDYHFLCAGVPAAQLDGYFSTEDAGRSLDLFPISEQARYRFPFAPAPDAVGWLESLARSGQHTAVYFDDIEKFGIWPQTYDWVYERGWLRQFIEGVLASPLIVTGHYGAYRSQQATRGLVYLPTTSYIEMNEWTLPATAARDYRQLVEQEKNGGRYEARKPWLRGGIWRNFMMRYQEANWLHKRMLQASSRLAALAAIPPETHRRMQEHLHRAQANDAYWHGLFGGLYLPHLRRAVWRNLIALEAELQAYAPLPVGERVDLDQDGYLEVFLRNAAAQAVVRADGDAAVIEFSSLALWHNFGDTLRRYEEGYYDKLHALPQPENPAAGGGIASAHDRVSFRHEIHAADVAPDRRPRALFVDDLVAADGAVHALNAYRPAATDSAETLPFSHALPSGGEIIKRYELTGARLTARYQLSGEADAGATLKVMLNLAMPSCDGFLGRYVLADGAIPCGFGQVLELPAATTLLLEDEVLGGALRLTFSTPLSIHATPHTTVSQSEAGFEKIMQAVAIVMDWPLAKTEELTVTVEVLAAPPS